MPRYRYSGDAMMLDFAGRDEAGEPVTVTHSLAPGGVYDLPDDDPTVIGWRERGILTPDDGVVEGPALEIQTDEDPPPPDGDTPPPPPPLDGVSIPPKDAKLVRRPARSRE